MPGNSWRDGKQGYRGYRHKVNEDQQVDKNSERFLTRRSSFAGVRFLLNGSTDCNDAGGDGYKMQQPEKKGVKKKHTVFSSIIFKYIKKTIKT